MAIKVGITGGIGSGKSVVSCLLSMMDVPVYLSDVEAKRLIATDRVIGQQLCDLVGEEVFKGNALNRGLLASYMFGYPERVEAVNAIVHPRVKSDFCSWVALHTKWAIVAMESAILVESGFTDEVDFLVMVYASREVRMRRVLARDGSSQEAISKRMNAQMSDEDKRMHADFVIVNDDETPLIPQVLNLISLLSKNNPYLCHRKK